MFLFLSAEPDFTGESEHEEEKIVEAAGLVKRYDGAAAVDGIDLTIRRNECFALFGPRGAGKTTIVDLIAGRVSATEGRLSVFGQEVMAGEIAPDARLGVVPQEEADINQTVMEHLLLQARSFGLSRKMAWERVSGLLSFVHLADRAKTVVGELSTGMKKLLGLARVLISTPELILLDEPTAGADIKTRELLWQKVRELRRYGITLLVTTSSLEEAARLGDRLGIMNQGRIAAAGTPEEIISRYAGKEVLELSLPEAGRPDLLAALSGDARLLGYEQREDGLLLFSGDAGGLWNRVREVARQGNYGLEGGRFRRCTLEDAYLRLSTAQGW